MEDGDSWEDNTLQIHSKIIPIDRVSKSEYVSGLVWKNAFWKN